MIIVLVHRGDDRIVKHDFPALWFLVQISDADREFC
jgi:hypothetical protein